MSIIKNLEGQKGLFTPATTWSPPVVLPSISGTIVAVDTEVKDNGLSRQRGSGWFNNDGHLLGVSIAWPGGNLYAPIHHEETQNFSLAEVVSWIENIFRNNHCCFFNAGYDLGWLQASGVSVLPKSFDDGSIASVLLDENWDSYSLESCCERAGIIGKDETLLDEAAYAFGIIKKHGTIKHGLWRLPARFVGPYAEQDAVATLELCQALKSQLELEGLTNAYQTELDLVPVIIDMRKRGIRIDMDQAERVLIELRSKAKQALSLIDTPWQRRCTIEDVRSPERLAQIFDAASVPYPRTTKTGQPSFQKLWLEHLDHPIGTLIRQARVLDDLAEKFVANYIKDYTHMGRIHAEIHPLRSDRGGAKTLRFAYSAPPLQQMPSRNENATLIRSMFIPEKDCHWLAADFKSQEPRLMAHYAHRSYKAAKKYGVDLGDTQAIVDYYNNDPKPDPHTLTAKLMGRERYEAKQLNLSLTYRMGFKELARRTNKPVSEAEELWNKYHESQPYIQGLSKFCQIRAQDHGYIRMIDGARRHFSLWQPKNDRKEGERDRYEMALKRWPGVPLERAFAYQAGNSLIQGSAARQIKQAMVACYRSGYLPLLTMHDELAFPVETAIECEEIGELMKSAVKLIVPVDTDLEVGTNWGNAKHDYRTTFA